MTRKRQSIPEVRENARGECGVRRSVGFLSLSRKRARRTPKDAPRSNFEDHPDRSFSGASGANPPKCVPYATLLSRFGAARRLPVRGFSVDSVAPSGIGGQGNFPFFSASSGVIV